MSRIWIKRGKILEPKSEIVMPMRAKGRFQLTSRNKFGYVRNQTPWFDNLITNGGLDLIGSTANYLNSCRVGTGNTAPAVSDTSLVAQVASTTDQISATNQENTSSPYGVTSVVVYRFAQGAAEGNLAEVGIGSTLWSRALILDGGGSPTTFPVAADEFLDVAYELTVYPPLVDATGTVDITGVGTLDYVARAANVGSGGGWSCDDGGGVLVRAATVQAHCTTYAGALGAITTIPSSAIFNGTCSGQSSDSYSASTYNRSTTATFDLTRANGNISAVRVIYAGTGTVGQIPLMTFQCSYDPVIPKTSSHLLTLNFNCAWARA